MFEHLFLYLWATCLSFLSYLLACHLPVLQEVGGGLVCFKLLLIRFSITWQVIFKNMCIFILVPFIKKRGREKCLSVQQQSLQGSWLVACAFGSIVCLHARFLGFCVSLPICVTWRPIALPKPRLVAKCRLDVKEWKILQSL